MGIKASLLGEALKVALAARETAAVQRNQEIESIATGERFFSSYGEAFHLQGSGSSSVNQPLKFSPDSLQILVAKNDKILLYGSKNGELRQTLQMESIIFKAHEPVAQLDFSKDGSKIYAVSRNGTIRIWQTDTGQLVKKFRVRASRKLKAVLALEREHLATVSTDGTIVIWDIETGNKLVRLSEKRVTANHAVLSPDGKTLFFTTISSALAPTVFELWDLQTGKFVWIGQTRRKIGIVSISFSYDSKNLVLGLDNGEAVLFDCQNGNVYQNLAGKDIGVSAAFSPDGRQVFVVGRTQFVRIYDAASGRIVQNINNTEDWRTGVVISPDGDTVVLTSSRAEALVYHNQFFSKPQQ